MKKGNTNFARVIDYLRYNGFVHNQRELADRIGSTPTTISRNKHGFVDRTDEETIYKFNAVFGHIINVAYLRGESDVMLVSDLSPEEKINIGLSSATDFPKKNSDSETSSLVNATIAAKDETIAALKREIDTKNDIIALLREQLNDLKAAAYPQKEVITPYGCPKNAAENNRVQP